MNAQIADKDDEYLPVGEILRRARLYYNQSIDDVGGILRIRSAHLEAIEEGRINDLPGRVYAFGFVRAYAEYLGLDGEKIVRLFKNQIGIQVVDRPDLHMPVAASESKSPNIYVIAGSLAVMVLGLAAFSFTNSMNDGLQKDHEIPPVPQELYEDAGQVGPFPGNAETAEGAIVPAPALVVRLKDSAWVEIRDASGKALLSRILKAGDSYTVPASVKGLVLDTGNVGALEFVIEGKALASFGEKGDVRRGIKLEPGYLRDLDARNPAGAKR